MVFRRSRSLVILVFLLVALAGCVGGDSLDEPDGPSQGQARVIEDVEAGKAALTGRVLTEDLELVVGANVILLDQADLVSDTRTDEEAYFQFDDLEPGDYRLRITGSECCRERIMAVTLEEGTITEAHVLLELFTADDLRTPYIVEGEWTGFIACGFRIMVPNAPGFECDFDPNQDRFHSFEVDPGIRNVVFALDWEPGAHVTEVFTVLFYHGTSWLGNRFVETYGPPPLEYIVDPYEGENKILYTINETTEVEFMVWAGANDTCCRVDVVYQQEFTMYYHLYYWEEAPEDASAIPG